jgi:hypothetical protein
MTKLRCTVTCKTENMLMKVHTTYQAKTQLQSHKTDVMKPLQHAHTQTLIHVWCDKMAEKRTEHVEAHSLCSIYTALESRRLLGISSEITRWTPLSQRPHQRDNCCGYITAYGWRRCLGGLKSTASTSVNCHILFPGEFSLRFNSALSTAWVTG